MGQGWLEGQVIFAWCESADLLKAGGRCGCAHEAKYKLKVVLFLDGREAKCTAVGPHRAPLGC